MICVKCGLEAADAPFCGLCGARQAPAPRKPKKRANGTGTVFRRGDVWVAQKCVTYLDSDGVRRKRTMSRSFAKKTDALNALPAMNPDLAARKREGKKDACWYDVYEAMLPTMTCGDSTLGNYRAAMNYFKPVWYSRAADVDIDDLQECIDECPRGKATRTMMKTVVGLIYKFGVPRGYFPEKLVLSDYLTVTGEAGRGGVGLPLDYLDAISKAAGRVPYADHILCQCYLGFRPSELLALRREDYDPTERTFRGGSKTDAGRDRVVTVSPKIQRAVNRCLARGGDRVFCGMHGEALSIEDYRAAFYDVLDTLGLANPTYKVNDDLRHTYTPHSCRHTFATLMKRIEGADKDKLALIGHTSNEMLRHYQDVALDDLRAITDRL